MERRGSCPRKHHTDIPFPLLGYSTYSQPLPGMEVQGIGGIFLRLYIATHILSAGCLGDCQRRTNVGKYLPRGSERNVCVCVLHDFKHHGLIITNSQLLWMTVKLISNITPPLREQGLCYPQNFELLKDANIFLEKNPQHTC